MTRPIQIRLSDEFNIVSSVGQLQLTLKERPGRRRDVFRAFWHDSVEFVMEQEENAIAASPAGENGERCLLRPALHLPRSFNRGKRLCKDKMDPGRPLSFLHGVQTLQAA
jgi:hypothetical protein